MAERELWRDAETATTHPTSRTRPSNTGISRSHRFAEQQARKLNLSKAIMMQ